MKRIVQLLASALVLTTAAGPASSMNIIAGLANALHKAWSSGFSLRSGASSSGFSLRSGASSSGFSLRSGAWSSGFSLRSGLENGTDRLKPELHALTPALSPALSGSVEASKAHPGPVPLLRGADFVISKFDKQTVEAFGTAWRRSGNGSLPREGVVLILQMADGGYSGREMGATNEHKKFTFGWHPATIAIVHTHPNSSDPRPQREDIEVADKYQVPVFTITSRGMYVYDPRARKVSKVMSNLDWLEASNWRKGLFARQ